MYTLRKQHNIISEFDSCLALAKTQKHVWPSFEKLRVYINYIPSPVRTFVRCDTLTVLRCLVSTCNKTNNVSFRIPLFQNLKKQDTCLWSLCGFPHGSLEILRVKMSKHFFYSHVAKLYHPHECSESYGFCNSRFVSSRLFSQYLWN